MTINQLIAKLEAMSVNRELPIQVYDFTDIFQIAEIVSNRLSYFLFSHDLVVDSQTRGITVGEFIDALTRLAKILYFGDMVIVLPDGTRHTLGKIEFDQKNQTYAITLGKVSEQIDVLEKHIFVSLNN